MNPIGWFLIVLFLIVIFILIFCAYNSRCKKRKTVPLIVDPCCKKAIAQALRVQTASDNLAASMPITSSLVTEIAFTTPGPSNFLEISVDGHYNVSYNLQLYWFAEASVETRVWAIYPDTTPADSVQGSQTRVRHRTGTVDNVTHYFRNYFPTGTKLYLQAQSSVENAVEIPTSGSATLFTPTTLASLYVSQV